MNFSLSEKNDDSNGAIFPNCYFAKFLAPFVPLSSKIGLSTLPTLLGNSITTLLPRSGFLGGGPAAFTHEIIVSKGNQRGGGEVVFLKEIYSTKSPQPSFNYPQNKNDTVAKDG